MIIETKFKPGEFVYLLDNNSVIQREIDLICITVYSDGDPSINYHFPKGEPLFEHMVFGSKEDLLKSL